MSPYDVPVALGLLALTLAYTVAVIWRGTRKDENP